MLSQMENYASYPGNLSEDPVKDIVKNIKNRYSRETGKYLPLTESFTNPKHPTQQLSEKFSLNPFKAIKSVVKDIAKTGEAIAHPHKFKFDNLKDYFNKTKKEDYILAGMDEGTYEKYNDVLNNQKDGDFSDKEIKSITDELKKYKDILKKHSDTFKKVKDRFNKMKKEDLLLLGMDENTYEQYSDVLNNQNAESISIDNLDKLDTELSRYQEILKNPLEVINKEKDVIKKDEEEITKLQDQLQRIQDSINNNISRIDEKDKEITEKKVRGLMQKREILDKLNVVETRNRMLQLSEEKNIYKTKVINTMIAVILGGLTLSALFYVRRKKD